MISNAQFNQEEAEAVIQAADEARDHAKASGRICVEGAGFVRGLPNTVATPAPDKGCAGLAELQG